jgi:ATP-dependent RNA helicase SUPV3L1/SUV3
MRDRRITAVLGPTNTGKTHLAIERMLGHASGVMGFPLRLLARENYDRVVRIKGAGQVALITGEEKIVPPRARYFLCTVESMPLGREVEFLAVDEIQLAADPDRGHVFTDRLLHARGLEETMFLGAETIRPLIRQLVPEAEIVSRPRMSTLSYAGPKKITRLPPRSAVVAFSAAEVYATAELMRRQRGGTAVVLGALSPRTRNAQVGMFEAGEVDYLVATDAIGMGLNLGLDHVCFARLRKFDGKQIRNLGPQEVAQIAGRAGRHMSDGTFGTTTELGGMSEELVEAVEEHAFDPLTALFWRNGDLDFGSPKGLLRSLDRRPVRPELIRVREAEDQQVLAALSREGGPGALADTPERVRLLWEVCQIPDFRKSLTDAHVRLLGQIYRHLIERDRRLPEDFVAGHIARLDRDDGDIDALVSRIAHIRTWTFVTHRADWLEDAAHWQERARRIEDKLSDALHERLTQRFVDKRTATLVKRLGSGEKLLGAVRADGEVLVEGEHVGRLQGFRFRLDASVEKQDARPLLAAARRALAEEIPLRIKRIEDDDDGSFRLTPDGALLWREAPLARLAPGDGVLTPQVEVERSEFLDGPARERLRLRLVAWLGRHLRNRLGPLFALEEAPLSGAARGLAFQLAEDLGCLPRAACAAQIAALGKAERKTLTALGVRIGAQSIYLPALLKPRPREAAALLQGLRAGEARGGRGALPMPEGNPEAWTPPPGLAEADLRALGYRQFENAAGRVAVRADALERLAFAALKRGRAGPFAPDAELARPLGGRAEEAGDALAIVLPALGYWIVEAAEGRTFHSRPPKGGRRQTRPPKDGAKRPAAGRRRRKPAGAGQAAHPEAQAGAQTDTAAPDAATEAAAGAPPPATPAASTASDEAPPPQVPSADAGADLAAEAQPPGKPKRKRRPGRRGKGKAAAQLWTNQPGADRPGTASPGASDAAPQHADPPHAAETPSAPTAAKPGKPPKRRPAPKPAHRKPGPAKPERAPHPDSPFAALAALKKRMSQ